MITISKDTIKNDTDQEYKKPEKNRHDNPQKMVGYDLIL